jgi:hypothetical protein
MILNMPFDEPERSPVAYDYSPSRADGAVVSSKFVAGRRGSCIEFNGSGYCQIPKNLIPVSGSFTVAAWLMPGESQDGFTGKMLGFWFAWSDVNGFRERWIRIFSGWHHVAVTKSGLTVRIYLNGQLIDTVALPVQPTGFAILQDAYFTEHGYGLVDDLRAYSVALSQAEVGELISSAARLSYLISGVNLKDFGVTVSESSGILDLPKLKPPVKVDWPGYHGEVVDLTQKRVEAREIELKCWMLASGKVDFVNRLNRFMELFQSDGTQRLTIDIHPTKPLLFEVYCESGLSVSKRWRDEQMVGEFTLKLREPDPVKRVLRHQRISEETKTLTITITTAKSVTIHWGDGAKDYDVFGENVTISHSYSADGVFFAVITGVIEEITAFSTNGILVWSKI